MKKLIPLIVAVLAFIVLAFGYSFMYTQVSDGASRATTALSRVDALSERDALIRSQQIFLENNDAERVGFEHPSLSIFHVLVPRTQKY